MASYLSKNKKSSASTCTTEGSTTSSSPASSVNLVTTNSHISQQQHGSISGNNNNNAPKYGTLVPNRIFVGGISVTTTETELAQLFSAYGNVKATKVISDRAGVSKGYGFVTFETEEEAKRLMRESDCIVLKERKLNIAPAIKKQPFNRSYEAASPPAIPSNTIFYQNGVPYTFHNGVAYFPATPPQPGPVAAAGDPAGVYQTTYGPPPAGPTHSPAAASYPMIFPCPAPPTMYVAPQQFQYQPMPPPAPTSQYVFAASTSSTSAAVPGTGPPTTQGSPMMGAPAPLPPTQHYYTSAHLNPTDLYYGIPQPYPALISNEGMVYETPPPTETSSNQSAEDTCSNSSNSDTVRSGGGGPYKQPADQEKMVVKLDNRLSGWTGSTNSHRQNTSTPVVSLLKLQQMGEELDSKKCSSPDFLTTPPFYQVPPPPKSLMPVLYQSVLLTSTGQPLNQYPPPGVANGHADHVPYLSKPYPSRRCSGGSSSHMAIHIPPFPPKFHFMNNNSVSMSGGNPSFNQKRHFNRNQNNQYRGRGMHRRFFGITNSTPTGRNTSVGNPNAIKEDDAVPPTTTNCASPPPAPYSPMTRPVIVPSDSFSVSPPQQVQFYSGGSRQTYYSPCNGSVQQQTAPPSVQPRRFMNNLRVSGNNSSSGGASSNSGSSRGNGGNGGKYSKNLVNGMQQVSGVKVTGNVEEGSLGGAGDAPPNCQMQGSVIQETCHQMQALSL